MACPALTFANDLKNIFPSGLCGIIFDCDGVMIDSAAANRYLYNTVLGALGLPPITPAQEKFAFQATFQQALEHLVPKALHPKMEAAVRDNVDYDLDIVPKITLMPGYREFITAAHAHGLKLAMDTNRTDAGARKILEHFHLPSWFSPVISATLAEPKPSPQGAVRICHEWDVLPVQALFVGDSPDDKLAAEGARVVFCGFGGIEGELMVNSWHELAVLLWGREI